MALKHQDKENVLQWLVDGCYWFIQWVQGVSIYFLKNPSWFYSVTLGNRNKGHSRDDTVNCFLKSLRMKFSILQWFLCFLRSGVWKAAAEFLWDPRRTDSSTVVTATLSSTLTLKGRSSTHGMFGQLCTDLQHVDIIFYWLYILLSRTTCKCKVVYCAVVTQYKLWIILKLDLTIAILLASLVVFLRQGAHTTKDELTASAFLTVQLDRLLNDQAVQVSVFRIKLNRACNICKLQWELKGGGSIWRLGISTAHGLYRAKHHGLLLKSAESSHLNHPSRM